MGWSFAFELNEVAEQQATLAGVDVHFVLISRAVLEKKAVEQGNIKFFELAVLSVTHDVKAQTRKDKILQKRITSPPGIYAEARE